MAFTWQPVNFVNDDPSTPLSAENLASVQAGITQAGQLADGKLSNVNVGIGLIGDGTDGNPLKVGAGSILNIQQMEGSQESPINFQTLKKGGIYLIIGKTSNGPLISSPGDSYSLIVLPNNTNVLVQIVIPYWANGAHHNVYVNFLTSSGWDGWRQLAYTDSAVSSTAQAMMSVASQQPMKLAALTTPESVTPELQSYIDQRIQAGINDFIQRFAAAYPMPVESDDGQSGSTVEKRADNE